MNYETSPNQRRITIHKCDSKKNYSKIDVNANREAMGKLGYSAYMLYMYFCMNATNFQLIPSRVAICAETALSKNVYYAAFDKLITEGYLVQKPGTQCLFDFYEVPSLSANNPETGKACPRNRDSGSPKQVENTKNNIENMARGNAGAFPRDEKRNGATVEISSNNKIFYDF